MEKQNYSQDEFPVGDIEDVEAIKDDNCYMGNVTLKAANVDIPLTEEQVKEIKKIRKDIVYFCNNYMKIATITDGVQFFKTYEFQERMIKQFYRNRFNIAMLPRQSGKCVGYDTFIRVRNKITKVIQKIPIGKFYEQVKNAS